MNENPNIKLSVRRALVALPAFYVMFNFNFWWGLPVYIALDLMFGE